ncbi:MAG TPA: hypothetical protein PKO07_05380 [Pseudomonadota bacterium]|nr:hypothetical protein [Pseudomonadota bacterium]HNN50432.1 hypothetical protein [Pseudomonadota bacterium]
MKLSATTAVNKGTFVAAWLLASLALPESLSAQEPAAPFPAASPVVNAPSGTAPGSIGSSDTASATPAASAAPSASTDKLSDLDRRTRELRDQVFRSKTRLTLLTENLLGSAQGGAKLVVVQKDQMGRLFQMVKVSYQLDGREVFVRSLEPGRPADAKEQTVYDGSVRPGDHTVGVAVVYRGDGNKVFSYYDQYTFTAKAAHRFSVTDGQTTRLEVVCREKGNPLLTRVEDRPSFDFRVESTKKAN